MKKKNTPKPLLTLKMKILQSYGKQYIAARELDLREDVLSAILSGRRPITSSLVDFFERKLGISRVHLFPEIEDTFRKGGLK
jgi:hypothetical protein